MRFNLNILSWTIKCPRSRTIVCSVRLWLPILPSLGQFRWRYSLGILSWWLQHATGKCVFGKRTQALKNLQNSSSCSFLVFSCMSTRVVRRSCLRTLAGNAQEDWCPVGFSLEWSDKYPTLHRKVVCKFKMPPRECYGKRQSINASKRRNQKTRTPYSKYSKHSCANADKIILASASTWPRSLCLSKFSRYTHFA